MKLRVLVDNNTYIDEYYHGEPALAFYIECENNNILFDTAYSDIFLHNAKKMNIDLSAADTLVLSHGHNDHTGGLRYLNNKLSKNMKLIAHPDVFIKRYDNGLMVGSPLSLNELEFKEYIKGNKPIKINDKLFFMGPIKRQTTFENQPVGFLENGNKDFLFDDTALIYKSSKGLFIITGCSHSGICNIILQAKEQFNDDRILGIIGGFHLLKNDERLKETVAFLKKTDIRDLYPCHCVSLHAKHKMMQELDNVHEVGVGLEIEIED